MCLQKLWVLVRADWLMGWWACKYCTLRNDTSALLCAACGSQNPTKTPRTQQHSILPKLPSKLILSFLQSLRGFFFFLIVCSRPQLRYIFIAFYHISTVFTVYRICRISKKLSLRLNSPICHAIPYICPIFI